MKGVSFYWLTLQTWYPIKTRAQCEQNILLFQITIRQQIDRFHQRRATLRLFPQLILV